jgi:hypothetical protein
MSEHHAWEPWVPEIGQHVRYRKSAECGYGATPDGITGVVTGIATEARLRAAGIESPGHRFEVTFSAGFRDRCAALELEPLP